MNRRASAHPDCLDLPPPQQLVATQLKAEAARTIVLFNDLQILMKEAQRTARQSWLLLRQRPPETPEHQK